MRKKQVWILGSLVLALLAGSVVFAAPKRVKLVYWTHWEQNPKFNAYYAEAGKEFARLHPECEGVEVVTVPYSGYEAKYLAAFMARTGAPDFFNGAPQDWAGKYQFVDKMPANITKRVDSEAASTAVKFGLYNGVRYGFPIEGGNFQYMFINTDMFTEAGLDPNKPPLTLTELLNAAKKLTKYDAKGKVIRSGFGVRYAGDQTGITDKFLPFLHAYGGLMVDPKYKRALGVVNSPAAIEALSMYGDMVNKSKVASLEVGNPEVAFGKGLAAIIFRESWLPGWLADNAPNIKYKVYPLPSEKVAPGPGALFGWSDLVYKYSPNKKLAWEFLNFMWSQKNDLARATTQGLMPVFKANFDSELVKKRPDYDAVMEMAKRPPAPSYFSPKMNEVAAAYGDAILDVIYGRKDAKNALNAAAAKINQILKQK